MFPLPDSITSAYPCPLDALPPRPWWRFVREPGGREDSFAFYGRFVRSDGRRGIPWWVDHDGEDFCERQVDLESWVQHLTEGIREGHLDEDQTQEGANEGLRRPLHQIEQIDADHPLPFPGLRTGQVWALPFPLGDEGFATLTVQSERRINGTITFDLGGRSPLTPSQFLARVRHAFLLADPICPHLAPWAPVP